MHYEILVEGQCELTVLSILMPRIAGDYNAPNTWKIHKHRGIGSLPENPVEAPKPSDTSLLGQLPAKLRAYAANPVPDRKIIILVDLDDKNKQEFHAQLMALLTYCENDFPIFFSFAEEELEAWYLGDRNALLAYNPKISVTKLNSYTQDSICDTWKLLLEADEPALAKLTKRDRRLLDKKIHWAKKISPHMDVNINVSPSFSAFKEAFS